MKSRLFASLAVGAAVVLGTSGCAMISPQATTIPYAAAEGVNVHMPDSPLEVRNAFVVADENGENGNFVAAVINDTADSHTLHLQFGEGDGAIEKTLRVPANSVVSLGTQGTDPLLVKGIDAKPGSDLPVSFQAGDGDTVSADIPVLDGTLSYLESLAP